MLTDNMQIDWCSICNYRTTANKNSMHFRILLDDDSVENSFNHVATIESFFESVLDCMAFDQIVACSHSITDDSNVHAIG